jgi:hypothetical protein
MLKSHQPKSTLIEDTAIEFAAAFYEAARMKGIDCKPYRNQRQYIKKNFEKFIPHAVKHLTEMLSSTTLHEDLKYKIYEALTERANWTPTINGQQITDTKFLH